MKGTVQQLPSLSLTSISKDDIMLSGMNLQNIVGPLLLIKPHLASAMAALVKDGSATLSGKTSKVVGIRI